MRASLLMASCMAWVASGCASAPPLPPSASDHPLVGIMETFCAGQQEDSAVARAVASRRHPETSGRLGSYEFSRSLSSHAIYVRTAEGVSAEVMYVEDDQGALAQCLVELSSQSGVDASVAAVNASFHRWANRQDPPLRRIRNQAFDYGKYWSIWESDAQYLQIQVDPPSANRHAAMSLSWIPLCGGLLCP